MDFREVVQARRSVRAYLPEPVGRDVLEQIVAAAIEAPSGCNLQAKQYVIVDDAETMDALRGLMPRPIHEARAAVVLLMEPKGTRFGEFWVQDASAAMENMLLAAVSLGYAGCWVEGGLRRCEEQLREVLNVPPSLRVWSLTPIGKPAEEPPRPPKPALGEVVHYNRFGGKK